MWKHKNIRFTEPGNKRRPVPNPHDTAFGGQQSIRKKIGSIRRNQTGSTKSQSQNGLQNATNVIIAGLSIALNKMISIIRIEEPVNCRRTRSSDKSSIHCGIYLHLPFTLHISGQHSVLNSHRWQGKKKSLKKKTRMPLSHFPGNFLRFRDFFGGMVFVWVHPRDSKLLSFRWPATPQWSVIARLVGTTGSYEDSKMIPLYPPGN